MILFTQVHGNLARLARRPSGLLEVADRDIAVTFKWKPFPILAKPNGIWHSIKAFQNV